MVNVFVPFWLTSYELLSIYKYLVKFARFRKMNNICCLHSKTYCYTQIYIIKKIVWYIQKRNSIPIHTMSVYVWGSQEHISIPMASLFVVVAWKLYIPYLDKMVEMNLRWISITKHFFFVNERNAKLDSNVRKRLIHEQSEYGSGRFLDCKKSLIRRVSYRVHSEPFFWVTATCCNFRIYTKKIISGYFIASVVSIILHRAGAALHNPCIIAFVVFSHQWYSVKIGKVSEGYVVSYRWNLKGFLEEIYRKSSNPTETVSVLVNTTIQFSRKKISLPVYSMEY